MQQDMQKTTNADVHVGDGINRGVGDGINRDANGVVHSDTNGDAGSVARSAADTATDGITGNSADKPAGGGKNAGKIALVLEGGSFRGQFTAGVIDVLLEHAIEFDACYGVSAGALNGLNFKARQIGRGNRINLAFCDDPRYIGARTLARTGSIVGFDFLFNDVQDRIDPLDYNTFLANPLHLFVTATNIMFGSAEYLPVRDASLDIDAVRASMSLPLVSPPVEIAGALYLDGGVADSVPVEHVLEDEGYDRAIVVLTQHRGFQKQPYEFMGAARARYTGYPYLLDALETRYLRYNEQREHIWEYERAGKILVVAPPHPVEISHIERDASKLLELYIEGRKEAMRLLKQIEEFV